MSRVGKRLLLLRRRGVAMMSSLWESFGSTWETINDEWGS
jgi:hypothetical protein